MRIPFPEDNGAIFSGNHSSRIVWNGIERNIPNCTPLPFSTKTSAANILIWAVVSYRTFSNGYRPPHLARTLMSRVSLLSTAIRHASLLITRRIGFYGDICIPKVVFAAAAAGDFGDGTSLRRKVCGN
ncbi:hypothetical protein CEXT_535291 [Caerostris extrusa]|uniref:Uncharacterized protein n=1 Tax=Caerostris extrusa TaxID=172846 RepID=A0AAV4WWE6_CAEEX|nr:hypothetical protein CEXT_535291 [Caerostris extrusa]